MRKLRVATVLLVVTAAAASAQIMQGMRGYSGRFARPVREGMPDVRDGFTFCRLYYNSATREYGGQGWSTDYPAADNNFMVRLSQITGAPVSKWSNGDMGFATVSATDPRLYLCPFLFASDVGTAAFSDAETKELRKFLLKGGLLWVDDFWGDVAWDQWSDQIRVVLPEYPIVDLPLDHPMLSVYYKVRKIPQIPSIQHWRRSGGQTSERGYESQTPHMRAIMDEKGRILVLMTHNTDIADGWERESEDQDFFYAFTALGYGVGINVAVWSLTH